MKVNLVVAQGVHSGKVIPITTAQFLIGRDPQCNLRPASPSVSKQHCGIFIRGTKVVVQDYGSTNGTCINGEPIAGEREVASNDHLKIGPLEFVIRFEATVGESTIVATASQAKAAGSKAPAVPAAARVAAAAPKTVVATAVSDEDPEHAAAMFLAMEDGNSPTEEAHVPDGSTVMDIPAMPGAPDAKPALPKPPDSSKAAADILSKYMRRPRS